jgi:hypothetical protein
MATTQILNVGSVAENKPVLFADVMAELNTHQHLTWMQVLQTLDTDIMIHRVTTGFLYVFPDQSLLLPENTVLQASQLEDFVNKMDRDDPLLRDLISIFYVQE